MGKCRKSPAGILRFGPLLLAAVMFGFVAVSAIGYVWHRNRNEQLSRENGAARRRLEGLQKANLELEWRLLGLTRPEALEARARSLGLVRPDPDHLLRVELVPVEPASGRSPGVVSLAAQRERR